MKTRKSHGQQWEMQRSLYLALTTTSKNFPGLKLKDPQVYIRFENEEQIFKINWLLDEPRCIHNSRKPELPRQFAVLRHEDKNFVMDNKKRVSSAPAKYNGKKIVDSHKGTIQPILPPQYVYKKA
jgi:hypothetical protein